MKKYLISFFILLIFPFSIVSCQNNNEWENIDFLFNMRFLTVDELKSRIRFQLHDNWCVDDREGWTYTFSNNDFDYEYRFRFNRNRLDNIETIIKPVSISPQEYNLRLRQHIARKFGISVYSNNIIEHGLELKVENLIINGLRFEITFRNRPFSSALFGRWEFNYDDITQEYIRNNITPNINLSGYIWPTNWSILIETMLNNTQIWEISNEKIIINNIEYYYDVSENEITLFSWSNIELTKFNYELRRNRIINILWNGNIFWEHIERDRMVFVVGQEEPIIETENIRNRTILNIIGNKIE